jgi:hypothetical protein
MNVVDNDDYMYDDGWKYDDDDNSMVLIEIVDDDY